LEISQDDCEFLIDYLNAFLEGGNSNAVSRVSKLLLEGFDHSQSEVRILPLFNFLATQSFPEHLGDLLRVFCEENDDFKFVMLDEIRLLLSRNVDNANLLFLNIKLFARTPTQILKTYQTVVANWSVCLRTAALMFPMFEQWKLSPVDVAQNLFAISPLATKAERDLFRKGFGMLTDQQFSGWLGTFAKTQNSPAPRPIEFKRVHFLMKVKPHLRNAILRRAGMSRRRCLLIASASDAVCKYATKIFGFTDDELDQMKPP
jgi:hypothetical protein